MRDTKRCRDTGRGRSRFLCGPWCGTRSRDFQDPKAVAQPLSHPVAPYLMNILLLNILVDSFFFLSILLLQITLQRSFLNIFIFPEYIHWANSPLGHWCDQKYTFYKIQCIMSRSHAERLKQFIFPVYYEHFSPWFCYPIWQTKPTLLHLIIRWIFFMCILATGISFSIKLLVISLPFYATGLFTFTILSYEILGVWVINRVSWQSLDLVSFLFCFLCRRFLLFF